MKNLSLTLQAALSCLLWATAIPTLKISYQLLEIPSGDIFNRLVLAGIRFLLAGLLIGAFLAVGKKETFSVDRSLWPGIAVFGLLNTTVQYMFFYVGVANTGAIQGVMLDMMKPLFVALLAHFLTRDDRMSREKAAGIGIGFGGILLANLDSVAGGGLAIRASAMGEGALVLSSLANAAAVMYGKRLMSSISTVKLNMYQFIIGALLLLGMGLAGAGGFHLRFNGAALALLVYSAILSAVAFVVWYGLIYKYSASSVTVHLFLIPVFGSIISSLLFVEEHLTWYVLASLVLIAAGIMMVNGKLKAR